MFGCGTETVALSTGLKGSVMSNCCTVFPNQLVRYMYLWS